MKIAILGAGFSGILLGSNLHKMGKGFVILEKESCQGGLCRTNKSGDYRWDFGVHALYSRSRRMADYFKSLPIEYLIKKRNARIFFSRHSGKGFTIGYPFESGIADLPLKERWECLKGHITARLHHKPGYSNLKEWIDTYLGPGIARNFMAPYNTKIWNCELSDISADIVFSKIDAPPTSKIMSSFFGIRGGGRAYQSVFRYPRNGAQDLIDYFSRDIKANIRLNTDVEKIIRFKNKWLIKSGAGQEETADIVISTIPLMELLKKTGDEMAEEASGVLKWNDTYFVMIGLKKRSNFQLIRDSHWVFFKGDEIFYRLTLMHNLNPEFYPAIVAEVTRKGPLSDKNENEIRSMVIKDLMRLGIISDISQIQAADARLLMYTYPIPTIGLEGFKKRIVPVLEKQNLFLFGRSGSWEYLNLDDIVLKAENFIAEKLMPCLQRT